MPSAGRAALAGMLVACAWTAAIGAEVMLYRGSFLFLVPEPMVERMLSMAPRDRWAHYPELTRRIDVDGDGEDDFVAIGLGSRDGHGVQVRYRLAPGPETGAPPRLGGWYWGVILDPADRTVFEVFNP